MTFTEEQAREAIRQHPIVAQEMKLSPSEMRIYLNADEFTIEEAMKVGFTSQQGGYVALTALHRKGYLVKLDKHRAVYGRILNHFTSIER